MTDDEHSPEYIVAHAACPVCGIKAGEACSTPFGHGVHAGRYSVVHLPTLADLAAAARLRAGIAALA